MTRWSGQQNIKVAANSTTAFNPSVDVLSAETLNAAVCGIVGMTTAASIVHVLCLS